MKTNACLGPDVNCYCIADVTLEDNAIVSQGAHLCTGSHDIDDPHHQLFAKKIVIKRGAWIATEAFIGPGVTIFEYGVVGARAVVFKNVPPHAVVAGNPAKLIRYRKTFNNHI
jgi:putative colanic acid biosynthesis acetyltransferase WcaF